MGEQLARMHSEFAKGYCSHPDAASNTCSDRIIRAHTVQRRGGLAAIAENGHVISVKSAFHDLYKNAGKLAPSKVGVRSASTFMGFCNRHDTEMFRPVETQSVTLTPETCFLLGFRAISYERLAKQAALGAMEVQREADKGAPFDIQCQIQEYLHIYREGLVRGLADTKRWKAQYDEAFRERQFDICRFYGVEYSEVLPVVGCGGFHPEFDFDGIPLQKISRGAAPHEHVTFNLTVLNGRSVIVLGWIEGDSGPAAEFVLSFANVSASQKADAVIRLAFEHIENIFIRPAWWRDLTDDVRNASIDRMRSGLGLGGVERESLCLRPDGHVYTHGVEVVDEIKS